MNTYENSKSRNWESGAFEEKKMSNVNIMISIIKKPSIPMYAYSSILSLNAT